MTMFTDDYFVLDYETGGFYGTNGFRPVEVALLAFKNGVVKLRHYIVDATDDPYFRVSEGAEAVHHIGMAKIAAEGVPAKTIATSLHEIITSLGDLPIWGHNCSQFDRPLMEMECQRYQLEPPGWNRWRDSAALYKAHKMGVARFKDEPLQDYFSRILSMRRKGLYFSLKHVLETEKLGITLDDAGEAPVLTVDPKLGLPADVASEILKLGAHRAAFDVLVTHALIQAMRADPTYGDLCK